MALEVEWVPYGRPAAEALREAISAAKADEPLSPVSVVVPSNHVGVAARRLLGSGALGPISGAGAGMAAVTFLTVYRLAELLGSAGLASGGRRPVSTPVIGAALRAALAEEPGLFSPVADHPATEWALVSAYRELRDVSDGTLQQLAAQSQRAADIVRLHRAARRQLVQRFYDEEDLIGSAIDVVRGNGRSGDVLEGPFICHLPERLSQHGAALLRAVAATRPVHVIAGTTGDQAADAEVQESVRRLEVRESLAEREDSTDFGSAIGHDPLSMVSIDRTKVVTTSDADDEIRTAIREVICAVRSGIPLERIAVLYATPQPYALTVHEQLTAAAIPHNGAAVIPLTARLAGRTLLGLLGLSRRGFRRDDFFSWMAGAPLYVDGRPVPATAWERLSREAGVVAGREDWDRLLTRYADERDGEAQRVDDDPEQPEWKEDQLRTNSARAVELRQFALRLIDDVQAAASVPRRWEEHAQWARKCLGELLGPEHRRGDWPAVEQKATERIERAIDRLGALEGVEGPVELEVFARTLDLELQADLGRVGRLGEGVLIGSVGMGVGLDLDLIVLLGLAEGTFPARVQDDSLLPDHERVVAGCELKLRADRVERQHHELLAAMAGAKRQVLCFPRGDLRQSSERVPSRWVVDIAVAISGIPFSGEALLSAQHPWLIHVASYDQGLRTQAFPATAREYRLRALMVTARNPAEPAVDALRALGDPVLDAAATSVAARRSPVFTRFDGNLAGLSIPSPVDRPTSATRLELWARCPFAYLVSNLLGIDEVQDPEDRLYISPLDRGSLVHEALDRFVKEVLARPVHQQPGPGESWTPEDKERLVEIAEQCCDYYERRGLVGRPIFWHRDRVNIITDLEHWVAQDNRRRAEGLLRPEATELEFGLGDARLGPVELALSDGRSVRFRGKVDRVDVAQDQSLRVIDYKTGSADSYVGLNEENPDDQGTRLQLPVYGLAARSFHDAAEASVRAEYWFITTRGGFRRVGFFITEDVLRRVSATVNEMVHGIDSGVFPSYPRASSTTPRVSPDHCGFCDPDGLGVADLRRQLERKRSDPALKRFFALVDDA